ncbi:hypothetical protein RJ639_038696 [Escallonia herrerae]|uniref:MLO-like protein n=1 Tax=Escallonia herrerae TaxID=1293975 RepID=A0AA89B854_9ASTE|nr:hypothetical protein RJ639_038696 [Escallonia herrerae]
MAAGEGSTNNSLQYTPTWALATVCLIFIFLGILIEHLIHLLCHVMLCVSMTQWLKTHRKNALYEAFEKLKSVLMLLGFISLLLAVTQRPISKICVPNGVADYMLPCRKGAQTKTTKAYEHLLISSFENTSSMGDITPRQERELADASSGSSDHCGSKGKSSLISQEGLNQLSTFIFVLAIMQIAYSCITMALGRAKICKANNIWTEAYECVYHDIGSTLKCFLRQFFHSVAKVDYLTLRHGFISAHLSTNKSFDFRKYIQRSLEDDFKVIIVLVLGTKLEVIVAKMALQLKDQNTVIVGAPVVQPNDDLFWFGHPQFVLTLLHFTLFMNAFELSFFIWVTLQFGIKSCYHESIEIIVIRVMGSNFKSAVLEGQTVHAIRQWHAEVKTKRKKLQRDNSSRTSWSNSRTNSPLDFSSHMRTPTLAEFSSRAQTHEITELEHDQEQVVVIQGTYPYKSISEN